MDDQRISQRKRNPEPSVNDNKKGAKPYHERDPGSRSFRRNPHPGPQFDHYSNLNSPREKVLEKALQANLICLRKKDTPRNADYNKICRFHNNRGHTTEECYVLKDELERLIRACHLR